MPLDHAAFFGFPFLFFSSYLILCPNSCSRLERGNEEFGVYLFIFFCFIWFVIIIFSFFLIILLSVLHSSGCPISMFCTVYMIAPFVPFTRSAFLHEWFLKLTRMLWPKNCASSGLVSCFWSSYSHSFIDFADLKLVLALIIHWCTRLSRVSNISALIIWMVVQGID